MVLGPGLRGHVVSGVHLLPVEPTSVVMVLVTEAGRVHQAVVDTSIAVTPLEVEEAAEILSDMMRGGELGEFHTAAPESAPPVAQLVARASKTVEASLDHGRDIYVGGTSRMVDLWEDLATLHRVLALLEREAAVLELLDDQASGTSVRLGSEIHAAEQDLAVVSSAYTAAGARSRMGVLGPMRMDYRRAIRVVEEVSDALGDSLNH